MSLLGSFLLAAAVIAAALGCRFVAALAAGRQPAPAHAAGKRPLLGLTGRVYGLAVGASEMPQYLAALIVPMVAAQLGVSVGSLWWLPVAPTAGIAIGLAVLKGLQRWPAALARARTVGLLALAPTMAAMAVAQSPWELGCVAVASGMFSGVSILVQTEMQLAGVALGADDDQLEEMGHRLSSAWMLLLFAPAAWLVVTGIWPVRAFGLASGEQLVAVTAMALVVIACLLGGLLRPTRGRISWPARGSRTSEPGSLWRMGRAWLNGAALIGYEGARVFVCQAAGIGNPVVWAAASEAVAGVALACVLPAWSRVEARYPGLSWIPGAAVLAALAVSVLNLLSMPKPLWIAVFTIASCLGEFGTGVVMASTANAQPTLDRMILFKGFRAGLRTGAGTLVLAIPGNKLVNAIAVGIPLIIVSMAIPRRRWQPSHRSAPASASSGRRPSQSRWPDVGRRGRGGRHAR